MAHIAPVVDEALAASTYKATELLSRAASAVGARLLAAAVQCSGKAVSNRLCMLQRITCRSSRSVAMPFIPPPSMVRIRRPLPPMGALPTARRTASFSPVTPQ